MSAWRWPIQKTNAGLTCVPMGRLPLPACQAHCFGFLVCAVPRSTCLQSDFFRNHWTLIWSKRNDPTWCNLLENNIMEYVRSFGAESVPLNVDYRAGENVILWLNKRMSFFSFLFDFSVIFRPAGSIQSYWIFFCAFWSLVLKVFRLIGVSAWSSLLASPMHHNKSNNDPILVSEL